jgi:hypothetical protein
MEIIYNRKLRVARLIERGLDEKVISMRELNLQKMFFWIYSISDMGLKSPEGQELKFLNE